MKDLDTYQKQAVLSTHRNTVVTACPGAGKTTVICERINHMIEGQGLVFTPSRIVLITYTNAAANEFRKRLPNRSQRLLKFSGTIHGFAKWWIEEYCPDPDGNKTALTVMDEDESMDLLTALVEHYGLTKNFTKTALKEILRRTDDPPVGLCHDPADNLYRSFLKRQWDTARYSFAGLLATARREMAQRSYEAFDLVVDEYQDASKSTHELLEGLKTSSRFYVGDANQCQPPGTYVETDSGQQTIEHLKDGDTVRAYDRKSGRITGGHKIRVAARHFKGELLTVNAGLYSTNCTPNHKWLVRWSDRKSKVCITYLMWRRDLGFRVGWCQLFQHCEKENLHGLHFFTRCRLEKADMGWILGVHDSRTDASVEESILSVKYQIPTVTFEPVNGATHLTREALDRIFQGSATPGAVSVLEAFGRCFEHPLYTKNPKRSRTTFLEVTASNLLHGLHSVPLEDGTWGQIKSISRKPYCGLVYSLDVEKHHSYVADGICTLNSIFGFIGGSPERLLELASRAKSDPENWTHVQLENTYRCAAEIAEAANKVVDRTTSRTVMASRSTGQGIVDFFGYRTSAEEQIKVANDILTMRGGGEEWERGMAVLCRTNAQCEEMRGMLRSMGIPVTERRRRDQLPGLRSALVVLDYLAKPWNESAIDAVNKLTLSPKDYTAKRQHALKECKEMEGPIWVHMAPSNRFRTLVAQIKDPALQVPEETVQVVERLEKEMNDGKNEISDLAMLLRSPDFEAEVETRPGEVTVTTIHGAKGLEWDAVWIIGCNTCYWKGSPDEERRLFYVALTRARSYVCASWADLCSRSVKGRILDPVASEPIPAVREHLERTLPRTRLRKSSISEIDNGATLRKSTTKEYMGLGDDSGEERPV